MLEQPCKTTKCILKQFKNLWEMVIIHPFTPFCMFGHLKKPCQKHSNKQVDTFFYTFTKLLTGHTSAFDNSDIFVQTRLKVSI